MTLAAFFAALITVCSWISLPVADIAFTMQTFGVFLALGLLGGKWGSVAIAIYLLLGAVGMPVFSGFRGGVGMLAGVTGGYLWGFSSSAWQAAFPRGLRRRRKAG
jgi:biotin transport system substrate-specific component